MNELEEYYESVKKESFKNSCKLEGILIEYDDDSNLELFLNNFNRKENE